MFAVFLEEKFQHCGEHVSGWSLGPREWACNRTAGPRENSGLSMACIIDNALDGSAIRRIPPACRAGRRGTGPEGLHAAVPFPVTEIDDETDHKPDDQAQPGVPRKAGHQVRAYENAKDRDGRDPGRFERAGQVRSLPPQDPNARAHDYESKQRPDADEFTEFVNRNKGCEDGHEEADENRRNPWCPEPRGDRPRPSGEKSIPGHGKEDGRP